MAAQLAENVRKFLEKPNFAVLATHSKSGIQATPVWFLVADGRIMINTRKDRLKLRNMEKRRQITLTIVDRENPYSYVQIQGKVAAFDAPNGGRDIERLSHRYRGGPYAYPAGDGPQHRVTVYIEPERVQAYQV